MAEVWVAHQFLEKGLSDGLSGTDPELLRSRVPRYHLTVHILGGLPAESESNRVLLETLKFDCSRAALIKGNAEFCYLKYIRENSFSVAGANRSTVPVSF